MLMSKRFVIKTLLGWVVWIMACEGVFALLTRYTRLSRRETMWVLIAVTSWVFSVLNWFNTRGIIRSHDNIMHCMVGLTREHLHATECYDALVKQYLPEDLGLIDGGATRTVNSIVEMMQDLDAQVPPLEFTERMTRRLLAIAYGGEANVPAADKPPVTH